MALIGEMQYLTIGGKTYSLPAGGGGTVTSVAISNATNGGLSISGSPISSSGMITIGHSNVLNSAQTTQAVYPITIDKNGHISAYGNAVIIPTVNNATLTIQKNGTTINSFTANASSDVIANITVPTKLSELTNDSGYITNAGVTSITTSAGAHSTKSSATGAVSFNVPTKTSHLTNDSGFLTSHQDISGKIDTAGTGLSKSGTTLNHSNSVTAQTTQAVYPIKIDAQGHISDYGTAINLEDTKVFLVTLTQNGDDYVSDKTAEEIINAYNAGRVVILLDYSELYYLFYIDETHDTNLDSYTAFFYYFGADFNSEPIDLNGTNITISTVNGVTTVYYNTHGASIASGYHTHGNITNAGDITTTATIASGDRLVINDESASKVTNSSITFGTSTSQYLANNGTWQNVPSVPTKTSDLTNDSGFINSIKTINNQSLIGSGDITVSTTAAQIIRWTESA